MGDKVSLDRYGQQHQYQKNPASKAKFAEKKKKQKLRSNFTPFKRIFFNSLGSGGQKMLKRSEPMQKISKKLFDVQFYTLYEQKFSNL